MIMKQRRPGRPPVKEHREVRVVMLLTHVEYDALADEAHAMGCVDARAGARQIVLGRLRVARRIT